MIFNAQNIKEISDDKFAHKAHIAAAAKIIFTRAMYGFKNAKIYDYDLGETDEGEKLTEKTLIDLGFKISARGAFWVEFSWE